MAWYMFWFCAGMGAMFFALEINDPENKPK